MTEAESVEFASKNWVWVPDPQSAFVKGFITEQLEDDRIKIRCVDGTVGVLNFRTIFQNINTNIIFRTE